MREAVLAHGAGLYRQSAYREAADVLATLVAEHPDDPVATRLLGLCRVRLGDPVAGVELLRRAYAVDPSNPSAALHLGFGLQALGQHAEAIPLFRACQPDLPDDPAPWLNLAISLLAVGDPVGSLRAARKARLRGARVGQAHYAVGQAHLALGEFAAARRAFAAATRHGPNLVDAWVNLGVAHYHDNDIEGAKAAMQRALQVAPAHRAATANLGAFLRLTGATDAAEALLFSHLARDPDAAEVRLNLAADLLQDERAEEALALLHGEPPAEPRPRQHWLAQRSLALLQLGRAAEAREDLKAIGPPSPELAPLLGWREVLLAAAAGDSERAEEHAKRLEAALATAESRAVPEHQVMARFNLARFWSQLGDADRAFPQWVQGHALLRRFQPFSRAKWRGFVDATIAAFSRERLHQGERAGNTDATPVFIVGMPRSGTTLAEQIVAAHRDVHGAGERAALSEAFARLGGGTQRTTPSRIAALDGAALDAAATPYLARLHALAPEARRVVDKMPGNFCYLGLVALLLPGARIIHCVRDPRDVGLSIFTYRFHGYHPYAHDLADLGWYIRQHDRLMAHWNSVLPNPVLTLALADWVGDFAGTLARVLDFVGLPHDAACERFHESTTRVRTVSRAQVRQPVNARGLGRWRAYARHLGPLLAELEKDPEGIPPRQTN